MTARDEAEELFLKLWPTGVMSDEEHAERVVYAYRRYLLEQCQPEPTGPHSDLWREAVLLKRLIDNRPQRVATVTYLRDGSVVVDDGSGVGHFENPRVAAEEMAARGVQFPAPSASRNAGRWGGRSGAPLRPSAHQNVT